MPPTSPLASESIPARQENSLLVNPAGEHQRAGAPSGKSIKF